MCLIVLGVEAHPRYPLVLGANRDEFYGRPTAPAEWWQDAPGLLAGRDLRGHGTWLGVTRSGRWAAVTNYRERAHEKAGAPSRGELVRDFLAGSATPEDYLSDLGARADRYNGFNLLIAEGSAVWWLTNRWTPKVGEDGVGGAVWWERVVPGVHALSNHLLDTPWPKVERGRALMQQLLQGDPLTPDSMLDVLIDRTPAADHDLPQTGIPLDLERALSSAFIVTPDYGTRSSTALIIDSAGVVHFSERSFDAGGTFRIDQDFVFDLAPPSHRPGVR